MTRAHHLNAQRENVGTLRQEIEAAEKLAERAADAAEKFQDRLAFEKAAHAQTQGLLEDSIRNELRTHERLALADKVVEKIRWIAKVTPEVELVLSRGERALANAIDAYDATSSVPAECESLGAVTAPGAEASSVL